MHCSTTRIGSDPYFAVILILRTTLLEDVGIRFKGPPRLKDNLRVIPSAQTHTAAPHCGSQLRVLLTLHVLWRQATFRAGFNNSHDPRDCSDNIIFRNNIGRAPRNGFAGPDYFCKGGCKKWSGHKDHSGIIQSTGTCFSLWGAGSNMVRPTPLGSWDTFQGPSQTRMRQSAC